MLSSSDYINSGYISQNSLSVFLEYLCTTQLYLFLSFSPKFHFWQFGGCHFLPQNLSCKGLEKLYSYIIRGGLVQFYLCRGCQIDRGKGTLHMVPCVNRYIEFRRTMSYQGLANWRGCDEYDFFQHVDCGGNNAPAVNNWP